MGRPIEPMGSLRRIAVRKCMNRRSCCLGWYYEWFCHHGWRRSLFPNYFRQSCYFTPGSRAQYYTMSLSVCHSVCLSVCLQVYQHPHVQTSYFLCTFSVSGARSLSGDIVIRYVLPVLRLTLYFILWTRWRRVATASASLQRHAWANAPAVWYYFATIYSRRQRVPRLDVLFVQADVFPKDRMHQQVVIFFFF